MTDVTPMRGTGRRVLLVAPQPFYEARGTPMNVLQMCRALTRAGYAVDVATYPFGEDLAMPGLTVHRAVRLPGIHTVPIGFSVRKVLMDAPLALLVARLLATRRYDVVHAVEESVFLVLPFTAVGRRLIYDLDSHISHQLEYADIVRSRRLLAAVRALERTALRRSRAAITVCASLTHSARALAPNITVFQIEDVPLEESLRDASATAVEGLRRELDIRERRVVVYTGNLEKYQGVDLLVEAATTLARSEPALAVVLVGGEDAQVGALRDVLRTRGLQDHVRAVGRRPASEMPDWMALGAALVSPRTQGENTPLKIYTYMHSGTPIVATDLPTHTQVLDATTAVLCPPTAEGLASGIRRVFADPQGSRAIAARARALQEREYTFATFQRKLLSAYDAVMAS